MTAAGAPNAPLDPTAGDLAAPSATGAAAWTAYITKSFGQGVMGGLLSSNCQLLHVKAAKVLATGRSPPSGP